MMVSICMITYNHKDYIKQAVEAILNQKTNFDFELIIANDNSTDNTSKIVNDIILNHPKGKCIRFLDNKKNIGMMPNFINALKNCTGKYVALCEGDDYWIDQKKLQKQVDFLDKNSDYAIAFHKVLIEKDGALEEDYITKKVKQTTSIYDLANGNYLHTCSVMYRNNLFGEFPPYFYKSPIGDYFLHLLNSQYGKIFYSNEEMAVYRVHNTSYWSSKQNDDKIAIWIDFIKNIKPLFKRPIRKILKKQVKKLRPKKISWFKKYKLRIKDYFKHYGWKKNEGLVILDDIFPSPLSPWRSNEYAEICKKFDKTTIYTDCSSYEKYNQNKKYDENLLMLTDNYPSLKNKIFRLKNKTNLNYNLAYTIFYANLIKFYPYFEKNKTNFAFTLYPGGGFGFNDEIIDNKLKEICKSKYFKGVLVNQHVTKKYLIENSICDEHKIKLIFGVPLNLNVPEIINFTYQKTSNSLTILFFANKYTFSGSDKGFDIFLELVKKLLPMKEKFNFIVIGNFSEKDVRIEELKNIINFKGSLNEFEFTKILQETHIIISANKPFILTKNAFDGFPLSTCVTASLFGNLVFMTDYFNEANNINLKNGEDFIEIKIHEEVEIIANKIIELEQNREELKNIALNGRNKMLHLYSYENQILPRIEFFKNLLM